MGSLSGLSVVAHYVSPPYRTDRQKLGHMQICTLLQRDNHASTPPLTSLMHFLLHNQQRQSAEGSTSTTTILQPLIQDYPGEPVPEKNIHQLTPIQIINYRL